MTLLVLVWRVCFLLGIFWFGIVGLSLKAKAISISDTYFVGGESKNSVETYVESDVHHNLFYSRRKWSESFPNGFKILKDIPVPGLYSPMNPIEMGSCTISKGTVIHPQLKTEALDFLAVEGIDTYKVTESLQIPSVDGRVILNLNPGDEVQQLDHIEDGVCELMHNGQKFLAGCMEESKSVVLQQKSVIRSQMFVKLKCKEGPQSWINLQEIENLAHYNSDTVISIGIIHKPSKVAIMKEESQASL